MKKISSFLFFYVAVMLCAFASAQQITINLTDSSNSVSSQAMLYFDVNLHPNYVYPEDSQIIIDTTLNSSQVYSLTTDGIACYVNGYGEFTKSVVVPLGVSVKSGKTYILSQNQISNFDATSIILLEDRLTGTFINLRQHNYYFHITQTGRVDGRFFLHISYPPQIDSIPANCSNQNGTINITEDSTITWGSCLLYDSGAHLLAVSNNVSGNISFPGLLAGSYNIEFDYGTYVATKPFHLAGGKISVDVTASTVYASINEEVQFTSNAINASTFHWDFGDFGTQDAVENPGYFYINAGIYQVTLTAGNNYSCQASGSVTMHISHDSTLAVGTISNNDLVKISNYNKDLRISVTNSQKSDYSFEIHGVSGQLLLNGSVSTDDVVVSTANLPAGIYLVTVKSGAGSLTRKIFLP